MHVKVDPRWKGMFSGKTQKDEDKYLDQEAKDLIDGLDLGNGTHKEVQLAHIIHRGQWEAPCYPCCFFNKEG